MSAVPALLTIGADAALNIYGAHKASDAAQKAADIQTQASQKVQATNTQQYANAMQNLNNLNMTYMPKLQAAQWNTATKSAWGQAGVTPVQPFAGTAAPAQPVGQSVDPGTGPVASPSKMNQGDQQAPVQVANMQMVTMRNPQTLQPMEVPWNAVSGLRSQGWTVLGNADGK